MMVAMTKTITLTFEIPFDASPEVQAQARELVLRSLTKFKGISTRADLTPSDRRLIAAMISETPGVHTAETLDFDAMAASSARFQDVCREAGVGRTR